MQSLQSNFLRSAREHCKAAVITQRITGHCLYGNVTIRHICIMFDSNHFEHLILTPSVPYVAMKILKLGSLMVGEMLLSGREKKSFLYFSRFFWLV